jgi:multiple antibiotic resistance protein
VHLADGNIALTLVALFSVMGIPSLPPVFLSVTEGMSSAGRRKIAIQATVAVALTMLVSFAIGQYILELFGIDIEAFRVAGALVVASMAWGMITAKPSAILGSNGSSPAIIPLAIPKTAGPGAIATVIALGESQSGGMALQSVIAIVGVTVLALLAMVGAGFLERTLGETGLNIVSRIFGLLLLAIAVTSIMQSLLAYFPGWGATG